MSARKPVLPWLKEALAFWCHRTQGTAAHEQAKAELTAAEAVIRACRRSQRLVCKAGCDCICCRALARLDRVTRGSK